MSDIKILVVDDNQDFAETLSDVLELNGYEVDTAYSGESAIEKYNNEHYDLAFMDVRLPGKNGVESFLEIRKIKPKAKIIMMTGYSVKQLLAEALDHGALDVLYKPIEVDKVLKLIENHKPDGFILISDDDKDFLTTIQILLQEEGYKIYVAHDGKKAIEQVRTNNIDLLILDLRMPDISGFDVYMELKKSGHLLPIIIVTAYADEEIKSLSNLDSIFIKETFRKPFDPNELVMVVKDLLPPKPGKILE